MFRTFDIVLDRIVESPAPDAPILVAFAPDDAERKRLVDEFGIDEHTLQSALDPDELSRLEFEPNHVAIIFKRPQNYSGKDQLLFRVDSTGIFLFKERVIVVLNKEVDLFEGRIFARIHDLHEIPLRLVYRSIYHFLEHMRIITTISDELEKKINASMENRYLINLFTLEKSLVFYLNSISTNGVLIEKLKNNAARIGFHEDEVEAIDDMAIENQQCYRQAEIHSNILASLMDARASIVGNNLNVLMKTLNIITIGIMVPTFVVSAFSMNIAIPLQRNPWAFEIIMCLAVLSVLGIWLVWRKQKW
jgi:magnesium transporter